MSGSRAETLKQLARLCLNGREGPPPRVEPSGSALDAILPGGGWQSGTVVELMPTCDGIGELRLLMPTLAQITQSERHVAMIAPPYIPFAPALVQHGLRLETMHTSFFLNRERLLTTGTGRMVRWRKKLFAFMSRNAQPATQYFAIPPNRVVELGAQVEL